MPELTLQVVSLDGSPLPYSLSSVFDESGGSIGRDESSTLSLPDKHRRVSRLHATVAFVHGVPTLANSSSSLPIAIGEQQIDCGESRPIPDGALVEIGPYVLRAKVSGAMLPSMGSHTHATAVEGSGAGIVAATVLPRPVVPTTSIPIAPDEINLDSLFPPVDGGLQSPSRASPFGLLDTSGSAFAAPIATAQPASSMPPLSPALTVAPSYPETVSSNVQPTSAGDPFADLLSGIGSPTPAPMMSNWAQDPQPSRQAPKVDHTSFGDPGISADPLAAFGVPAARSPAESPHQAFAERSSASGVAPSLIPEDFNPFAMPSSSDRNAADPLSTLLGGGATPASVLGSANATPSIDSLFQDAAGVTPAYGGANSSSLLGGLGSFGQVEHGIDRLIASDPLGNDPLAMLDAAGSVSSAYPHHPMRDDSAEVGAAFRPPSPVLPATPQAATADSSSFANIPGNLFAASASPVARQSGASAQGTTSSLDALTEAFLRGASLAPSALPHGLTPEIMATIGSLLRSATAGAVDMLAARAATKREVQASVTIISVQANNPLKFLPNADAALLQLLGKKMPGFMRADVAMRDAFDDLRAHEVGVIAGTRAALTEVLGKFDPAVLGEKLTKGSVLESLMPSARKAKLWDMYLERYLQIRREAEDDFQSIFGRAFVLAYERETARIKGDSSALGGER